MADKVERSDINQTVTFRVPPHLLYEALTSSAQMSAYTQTPCVLDPKEGGSLSLFGGGVVGKYLSLQPLELVFTFRFKEWFEEHESTVRIRLEEVSSNTTRLTLHQSGVPHVDRFDNHGVEAKVEQGWQRFFWDRIAKVLGYPKADDH